MHVLAFDVGGTSVRAAVVDDLRIVERVEAPTAHGDELVAQLVALARRLPAAEAIGIGAPGPLNADRRGIAFAGNLALEQYPLADLVQDALGLPTVLDDDANCAAFAEARLGAAADARSSVTIVVGTGIGAGIVVGRMLFRGEHAVAGEIGHVRVADDGRPCSCGRVGCLEAMANGAALADYAGGGPDVFAAAERGDADARAAIERVAGYLAAGVAIVASVVDPECVVLAGGVGSQPALAPLVRAAAAERCIAPLGAYLDVRSSALGSDAGLLGAALLVESEHA